jgi:putative SOS response-associated peptidase YedK
MLYYPLGRYYQSKGVIQICFFYSLSELSKKLLQRYQLKLDFDFELLPDNDSKYYVSGFDFPKMPVITNEQPEQLQHYQWGLIPSWVKSLDEAEKMRSYTLNARSNTVFEKSSFRQAIRKRRCLVPADGFYEWREYKGKKYPYYIYLKNRDIFSFAGIWDEWINHETGEILKTFSILTTEANHLMEQIHNTKKRMPVILPKEQEKTWFDQSLTNAEIISLTKPYDHEKIAAHTIGKLITSRTEKRNVPEIQAIYNYPELPAI